MFYFGRCNMGSVVLQLVALGIKNIEQFDFMDKPSPAVSNTLYNICKIGMLHDSTSLFFVHFITFLICKESTTLIIM